MWVLGRVVLGLDMQIGLGTRKSILLFAHGWDPERTEIKWAVGADEHGETVDAHMSEWMSLEAGETWVEHANRAWGGQKLLRTGFIFALLKIICVLNSLWKYKQNQIEYLVYNYINCWKIHQFNIYFTVIYFQFKFHSFWDLFIRLH